MFARKFLSSFLVILGVFYSTGITVLYLRKFNEERECRTLITNERRARAFETSSSQDEKKEDKIRQSYINLLETISSPGEERRVHFFRALFAYNLLSLGEEWRCNPPPQILGAVVNGVQGSTITLKIRKNDNREVFIFAVVE